MVAYGLALIPLILFLVLIGVLFFVFWIIMIVDASQRKFKSDTDKVVWILVIVLVGIIGALIYYFVIRIKDNAKSMRWFWIIILVLLGLLILMVILAFILSSMVVVE